MTIIINILGAPGIGKSTIAALLFYKMKSHEYNVEYVQEYAKKLIWTKRFDELNNQHQVTKKQYQVLKNMDGHIDFIITDGPLLHGVIYNKLNKDNICNVEKTQEYIYKCNDHFKNINILLTHVNNRTYVNAGRVHTESESYMIADMLKDILQTKEYKSFPASGEYIDEILEYIKDEAATLKKY
jgi:hypothetical protein